MPHDAADDRATDRRLEGLVAVARWHREHERFHAMNALGEAADLRRDANALKVLAGRWLGSEPTAPVSFDADDPLFQAAGCDDLNDVAGVATTGILFMEGEGEPAELTKMKLKLGGMAAGYAATSRWLEAKLDPAWARESSVLTGALTAAAEPRFGTLTRTTRTGQGLGLTARLLTTAVAGLTTREFRPATVRDNLRGSAELLHAVAWLLDEASSNLAEIAADLGRSDPDWTTYLDVLNGIDECTPSS